MGQFNHNQPNQAPFDSDKKVNSLEKQMEAMMKMMQASQQETNSLKNIVGQLPNQLSDREKGKFPSHPEANPNRNHVNMIQDNQAKSVTTLRSGKRVDNHVEDENNVADPTNTKLATPIDKEDDDII